jgi:hypothetical protein
MDPVGYTWLRQKFGLLKSELEHESYLGSRASLTHQKNGRKTETFLRQYAPRSFEDPLEHVEFGLKYDGVELAFLREVFGRLTPDRVAAYIQQSPTGVTGGVKCSHDGRGQMQPPRVGSLVMKEG